MLEYLACNFQVAPNPAQMPWAKGLGQIPLKWADMSNCPHLLNSQSPQVSVVAASAQRPNDVVHMLVPTPKGKRKDG